MTQYEEEIEAALDVLDIPKEPGNLYDPLRYFLSLGGKRMRPKLLISGYHLFRDDWQSVVPQALAIELFHNFTLIHDDIMDHAPTRRGKATVHTKWNHDIAILSGDVLLVKAYDLLLENNVQHLPQTLALFNQTAKEVCEGQQMDMDFEERADVSLEEYVEMIRLKTAVLLAASLQIGSILSGADDEDQNNLYAFGQHIGLAFQIQDDYLDVFGDPETFGKLVGGDILNNKKTYMSILLRDKIGEQKFMEMSSETDDKTKVERFRNEYTIQGINEMVLEKIDWHHAQAMEALNKVKTKNSTRPLEGFASLLKTRRN